MRLISLQRVGPQELPLKPLTDLLHGHTPAPQPLSAPDGAEGQEPHTWPAHASPPPQWTSFLWVFCLPIMPWASDCFARLPLPWRLLGRIQSRAHSPGVWLVSEGPVPHQSPRLLACKSQANHLCVAGRPREYRGLCRDQRLPTGRECGPGRPTGLGLELTSLRFRPQMR